MQFFFFCLGMIGLAALGWMIYQGGKSVVVPAKYSGIYTNSCLFHCSNIGSWKNGEYDTHQIWTYQYHGNTYQTLGTHYNYIRPKKYGYKYIRIYKASPCTMTPVFFDIKYFGGICLFSALMFTISLCA